MLLIYTGNGKGKTSACVGQAIRAMGQELAVVFAQFMKRAEQAGEQKMLASLLGKKFYAGGGGFFKNEQERPNHRAAAEKTLAWIIEQTAEPIGMLILDESIYALNSGLLREDELKNILELAQKSGFHLVLSGRGAPDWLIGKADMVTEMMELKHHWREGITAARGIEY